MPFSRDTSKEYNSGELAYWASLDAPPVPRQKTNSIAGNLFAHTEAVNPHGLALSDLLPVLTTVLWPNYPGAVWGDYIGSPGGGPVYDSDVGEFLPAGGLSDGHDAAVPRNYNEWAALEDVQVETTCIVMVTLPEWFDAWDTTAVSIAYWTTDDTAGEAGLSVALYRNTSAGGTAADQQTDGAWGTVTFAAGAVGGGTWVAGDKLKIVLTLAAKGANVCRIGEIRLAMQPA